MQVGTQTVSKIPKTSFNNNLISFYRCFGMSDTVQQNTPSQPKLLCHTIIFYTLNITSHKLPALLLPQLDNNPSVAFHIKVKFYWSLT